MFENLADIEALVLRCRSDQSREYIAEAVLCYRSGAYRAAIVGAWIAVVFDLVDKIKELSRAGDGNAQALEQQYEGYLHQIEQGNDQGVRSALDFERQILETCKSKLQLFSHQQFMDLQRLREDRHRCAHPSFQRPGEPYRPSAEHARLHLRSAVEHVLAQAPVQGKAATAEVVQLISSRYFPTEHAKALVELKRSPLADAGAALARGAVDAILFGYVDRTSPLFGIAQVFAALSAAMELHRKLVEERIGKQLPKITRTIDDADFHLIARLLGRLPELWALLDDPSRNRVSSFVLTGPATETLQCLTGLFAIPDMQSVVTQAVSQLDEAALRSGIQDHHLGAVAKDRALELLSGCHSYNATNSVMSGCVLPLFSHLTRVDVERIIRMPKTHNADLPGAVSYAAFIKLVRATNLFQTGEIDKLLTANKADWLAEQE